MIFVIFPVVYLSLTAVLVSIYSGISIIPSYPSMLNSLLHVHCSSLSTSPPEAIGILPTVRDVISRLIPLFGLVILLKPVKITSVIVPDNAEPPLNQPPHSYHASWYLRESRALSVLPTAP